MIVSETDLAYAAGMIDGEGTITIIRSKPRSVNASPTYALYVTMANNDKTIHDWFVSRFGGTVNASNRFHVTYQWRLCSNEASSFLESILPYLVLKKEQAIVGLDFQATKSMYKEVAKHSTPYHGGMVVPTEEIERREIVRAKIRELNHRHRLKGRLYESRETGRSA